MPKLTNRLPKNCRDRNQAFSWHKGERIYHGAWGTPEAEKNYKRFVAALLESPVLPLRIGKNGDAKRAEQKASRVGEFYDHSAYRRAVTYAIEKGNRHGVQIPHWSPYLLRNSAATAIELEYGLDEAQAQLGHTSANMTKRYSKAQLKQREKLALNRHNPFDNDRAAG